MLEMSSEITKDNFNKILAELGKEYRRRSGKSIKAEVVITGGAAVIAKYGFRDKSYDIDAIIRASSVMKEAANVVGDKYDLENNWLNSDFMKTSSYSDKLYQHSEYYKTFANILEVRTVEPNYLIATKVKSFRSYKHDKSDVVGIISEERQKSDVTIESVKKAYIDLYNEEIPEKGMKLIQNAFNTENIKELRNDVIMDEENSKELLQNFEKDYKNVLKDDNIEAILGSLKTKQANLSQKKPKMSLNDKIAYNQARANASNKEHKAPERRDKNKGR